MTEVLKYLVVDDDELSRLSIEMEAEKFPFLAKAASCDNAVEALEFISRFHPDIIFADIEMPHISGLDLVRRLAGKVTAAVFITSHPEFALEGYEMEVFDYLLKPVHHERFERCALRLRDFCRLHANAFAFEKEQENGAIIIKQGHDKHKLPVKDILYIEAMKDYTRVVTSTKQYLVLGTLAGMQEKLPAEKFTRIHRSYIVNIDKIIAVETGGVRLEGHRLPVGKMYKDVLSGIF